MTAYDDGHAQRAAEPFDTAVLPEEAVETVGRHPLSDRRLSAPAGPGAAGGIPRAATARERDRGWPQVAAAGQRSGT